ncbi:Crp/Fnr family transcriptional regulator [Jannaschia sp. Os4]|uniref:Crp/Fnr family transcriptional regulator n=1 Tax=Jannaschia sp. Os4 TaxID=2807617 RepID=UPI00193AD038|nr:Crp/Fnr family transcriptional regulator [Jannaschia sp. Os4]MBM2575483.1 Crp/Fnr family transcriptional regulator [Jannaschia sp. Os4]
MIEVHGMGIERLAGGLGRDRAVAAGAHLFRQGDPSGEVHLIREGHLKAYYLDPEGRERVKSLLAPGDLIGSMAALTEGVGCTFSLVAVSEARVRSIPFADLTAAAERDHAAALAMIGFLAGYARRKERREFELLCLSAEARQARALEQAAAFEGAFPQSDIAAWIGITPQAFSRIKKRRAAG